MNRTVRLAALSAGAIYEGEERRTEGPRADKLCAGLRVAVRILEELERFTPRWKVWRIIWVRPAVRVLRMVVEARCGAEEGQVSGGPSSPFRAGSSAPPLVDQPPDPEIP